MSIESDIFRKTVVDFAKLETYCFQKQSVGYICQKTFNDGDFRADIRLSIKIGFVLLWMIH